MMDAASRSRLEKFMEGLKRRNSGEMEFHQTVYEAAQYIIPYVIHARTVNLFSVGPVKHR